jgi:alpha/beta hydrolase fold
MWTQCGAKIDEYVFAPDGQLLPRVLRCREQPRSPQSMISSFSRTCRRADFKAAGTRGRGRHARSDGATNNQPERLPMDEINMSEDINHHRRRFFGTAAAVTFAATQLGLTGFAHAQPGKMKSLPAIKPGANTSFAPLKQIDAGPLNIGYAEAGPADGPAVILPHGWPYDIYSFVDVAPLLASAGYRVIVPYVRGYGTTRFLSSDTVRNGQPTAVAADTIALMDALKIEKATLAGFDWGARTADIIAALWPERCKALVSVSGYLIGSQESGKMPLPPKAELEWWYQFYFATERAAPAMTNTGTIFPS